MTDMLCPLLLCPSPDTQKQKMADLGIIIRRPNPWERSKVYSYVAETFSQGWADESSIAFCHQPITCFTAWKGQLLVGFAAYECTRRGFFGPTGVSPDHEKQGIGTALLLNSLQGLRDLGYVYGIIGYTSSERYYQKTVGAIAIPFGPAASVYGPGPEGKKAP